MACEWGVSGIVRCGPASRVRVLDRVEFERNLAHARSGARGRGALVRRRAAAVEAQPAQALCEVGAGAGSKSLRVAPLRGAALLAQLGGGAALGAARLAARG